METLKSHLVFYHRVAILNGESQTNHRGIIVEIKPADIAEQFHPGGVLKVSLGTQHNALRSTAFDFQNRKGVIGSQEFPLTGPGYQSAPVGHDQALEKPALLA